MSKIQSQMRRSLTLVVILLVTIINTQWAAAQQAKKLKATQRASARAEKQERASEATETEDPTTKATSPTIDDTLSGQGRKRLPPSPTPSPIVTPSPTPEPQETNSNFIKVAQELDRLQDFFSGGSGIPVAFDSDGARRSGFSPQALKLAEQMAGFTNDLIVIANAVSEKGNGAQQVQEGQEKAVLVMQKATAALENYSELNDFFSAASQRHSEEATKPDGTTSKTSQAVAAFVFETPATVCGGFLTPRPSRSAPWVQFTSNNPWNTLYQWGYHPTPDYVIWQVPAGGGWTRPQTYRPDMCKWNSFRDHAQIITNRTFREQKYTGWTPNGEPNPEVWNYSWPYPVWPAYVFWWHQTH